MCKSTGSLILKQYRRGKNRRSRDLLKVWKKKRKVLLHLSFLIVLLAPPSNLSCNPFRDLKDGNQWRVRHRSTTDSGLLKCPWANPLNPIISRVAATVLTLLESENRFFSPGLIETTSPEETLDVWLTWEKKKTHFSRIIITIIFCRRIRWYVTREGGRKLLSCKQNMKF